MPQLTIDGQTTDVPAGTTLLQAAQALGIEIPSLCHWEGLEPGTSCMVCVVRIEGRRGLAPACATVAQAGMVVHSEDPAVRAARRTALELLLSDHVGDCMGPCQVACPAHMDIPTMIRQIGRGLWDEAVATVRRDIALPAVAGRLCAAPCEKACRRAQVDTAVSICLLKRYVGDVDLDAEPRFEPEVAPATGRRVAVVGAGPAGLAAALYLQQAGHACTLYDDHAEPGGTLRYALDPNVLPPAVLDGEIEPLRRLGVTFRMATRLGTDVGWENLRGDHDAVFLALGAVDADALAALGLPARGDVPVVKNSTYETELPGVFAGGDLWRRRRMIIRALADGKEAAVAIGQYLAGQAVTGATRPFNSRMGRLQPDELKRLAGPACSGARTEPAESGGGFQDTEARAEALRCLHCDCRKPVACKLRHYAQDYGAKDTRYRGARRPFELALDHPNLVFESGKCIDCGICVRLSEARGEELGLTFIGRGFDVRVAVPFDRSIEEALALSAREVAAACPTGALSLR